MTILKKFYFAFPIKTKQSRQITNFVKGGNKSYHSSSKNLSYFPGERPLPHCEDCQHFGYYNGKPVCKLFKFETVSMNNGIKEPFYINSKVARMDYTLCGIEGWYFQPKQTKK